jgi:uncharacterized protein YhbP (UPF0306 family)
MDDTEHETAIEQARRIIGANKYLTLSTVDAAGRPWTSPVYFTPESDTRFLWVSSPDARHSRNIAARPAVAFAIFDSTVAFGSGEAAYFDAEAETVAPTEVEQALAVFNARFDELDDITLEEVLPPGPLRLYRASVAEASVLLRGGDPRNEAGVDTRIVIR